jgi:hypothetical protein
MSDDIVKPTPDPTVLTTEASERAKEASDKVDTLRDISLHRELELRQGQYLSEINDLKGRITRSHGSDRKLVKVEHKVLVEKLRADHRILKLMEAHRLELKGDSEKTLSTATIAAEKAVQAALAAAEKARDQQTIASQLATTKAEEASKEQMKQQGETFTLAIQSLTTGLSDVKSMLAEIRAEKRGSQEQVVVTRDTAADMRPMVDAITKLTEAQGMTLGRQAEVVDHRQMNMQNLAILALVVSILTGVVMKAFGL